MIAECSDYPDSRRFPNFPGCHFLTAAAGQVYPRADNSGPTSHSKEVDMVSLSTLWLPILLSAVAVFVASSIIHMVLPYHRSDYRQLPDEEKITAAIRAAGVGRGLYHFPYCTHKEMKSPAMIEKFKQGPIGLITIFPGGPPAMPKFLGMWFVFCLIVSILVACLTGRAMPIGAAHLAVFRIASAAGFLAYGVGNLSQSIWRGQPWSVTIKEVIDGLIYGMVTGGILAWLWPM